MKLAERIFEDATGIDRGGRCRGIAHGPAVAFLCLALCGCSVTKFAANRAGDALAGGGTVFAGDDDPELIKAAAPFSLKMMEALLTRTPEHRELLLAACSGFTEYAYAFVEQDADEESDFTRAQEQRARARRMYLRARNYGMRGLATRDPKVRAQLASDPKRALLAMKKEDVPLLYWTAASWARAIALSKDNPDLVADLPAVEALIDRALALDESFDRGAIHSFLISYEMVRPRGSGAAADRARRHFERAVELSCHESAAPFVALAEATCVPAQDRSAFESLLKQALQVDPDKRPEERLLNAVMQRRARWLLSRVDDLFAEPSTLKPNEK